MHWPNERDCFRGVVSGFDRETWLHSLQYDDGDVEPAIRLWREVVHLGVPEDERADREEATREKVAAAGAGADADADAAAAGAGADADADADAAAAAEVGEDISAKDDVDRRSFPVTPDRRSSRKRGSTEIAIDGDPVGGRGGGRGRGTGRTGKSGRRGRRGSK